MMGHIPDCVCPICQQARKAKQVDKDGLPLAPRGSPTVSVLMSAEEKASLERMASEARMSQSSLIRTLLLKARRRKSGQQH